MTHQHTHPHTGDAPGSGGPWWRSATGLVLAGFLAVTVFFLVTEHTALVFGVLPFLLVLACPLMHVLMHHGHKHGDDGSDSANGGSP